MANVPVTGMYIGPKVGYVAVGQVIHFDANVLPTDATNQNFRWEVENEAVALVTQEGKVTGMRSGETYISVISEEGNFIERSRVRVLSDDEINVTKVNILSSSGNRGIQKAILGYGESLTIKAKVVDQYDVDHKGVAWSTSDRLVARVSSGNNNEGIITAGSASGTATITATSIANPSVYATFTVIVKPSVKHVRDIRLNPSEKVLSVGSTFTPEVIFTPADADNKTIIWKTNQGSTVAVDKNTGTAKGIRVGSGLVIAMSEDGCFQHHTSVTVVKEGGSSSQVVRVSPSELVLEVGSQAHVLVSIVDGGRERGGSFSKSYSDSKVAFIHSGVIQEYASDYIVSGKAVGFTTITFTLDEDTSKRVVLNVRVVDSGSVGGGGIEPQPQSHVDFVHVSSSSLSLREGTTARLYATVGGTDQSVVWENSNPRIITLSDDGSIVAEKAGTATVTVRSVLDGTKFDTCHVTVYVIPEDPDDPPVPPTPTPTPTPTGGTDTIVRLDYNGDGFDEPVVMFQGDLGFSEDNPIESVVYYETEKIQKIYWVDGVHVLRFMNFMASEDERGSWDNTSFDSNRAASFDAKATIEKNNSGVTRANGVVQYLLTYFNKHGQESGYVWISDLIYLSPVSHGGSADGTNNNLITLKFTDIDQRFTHLRVYSVFRSSYNGTPVAYLISEQAIVDSDAVVIDDGSPLATVDVQSLLYLGSLPVVAGTLTHKDQTLFLGDLRSLGRSNYDDLEKKIRRYMFNCSETGGQFVEGKTWESECVEFVYSDDSIDGIHDIPYTEDAGLYTHENQLIYSSSEILTFKGGEKYRFALKFKLQDGTETDAFWIGDKENPLYPVIVSGGKSIKRVVVKCTIPKEVIDYINGYTDVTFSTVQLMIAEANFADRSVKAQGVVNPTMFNVWERYQNRTYSVPSWIARVRNAEYANQHFESVAKSDTSLGEIQCNYWKAMTDIYPFYQYKNYTPSSVESIGYVEEFDNLNDFETIMVVYDFLMVDRLEFTLLLVPYWWYTWEVGVQIFIGKAYTDDAQSEIESFSFSDHEKEFVSCESSFGSGAASIYTKTKTVKEPGSEVEKQIPVYSIERIVLPRLSTWSSYTPINARDEMWTKLQQQMLSLGLTDYLLKEETYINQAYVQARTYSRKRFYFNAKYANTFSDNQNRILDYGGCSRDRWYLSGDFEVNGNYGNRVPSYKKKHIMFVDENVVTLNSPELEYGISSFDLADYKFRIVGVAKMSAVQSDYSVDATSSSIPSQSLERYSFSRRVSDTKVNSDGIITWPLWKDYSLDKKPEVAEDTKKKDEMLTEKDYDLGNGVVRYWLYMWQQAGIISGYHNDEDPVRYSELKTKTFANLRFFHDTIFMDRPIELNKQSIRIVDDVSKVDYGITVGKEVKSYSGIVQLPLSTPGSWRYPIVYSKIAQPDTDELLYSGEAFLYSMNPVQLDYIAGTHAVISLTTTEIDSEGYFTQEILPRFFESESVGFEGLRSDVNTGALLPWDLSDENINPKEYSTYPFHDYRVTYKQQPFVANSPLAGILNEDDKYLLIGEVYTEFEPGENDTRYGGIYMSSIESNRFVAAGSMYRVGNVNANGSLTIYGNQGDTYFQRWDGIKTKSSASVDVVNGVIEITSVMLETHLNLDGRFDKQRGITALSHIDTTTYGQVNAVYSQPNNFVIRRDLDEDFNLDEYRSSITWTLQKNDSARVDEWTHVTLASTLKLDGDKGICRALRRFQNSLVAFQDRGISEILFNSRTQLTTEEGVPVEIGNSGKVDGKRYLTNKYGCTNKWSIVEGKGGVYFVDNTNKMFGAATFDERGRFGITNISGTKNFGVWFRENNSMEEWNPKDFNNIVTFYDKVHSDVYIVKNDGLTQPCLVYNELLGTFTSFYDYGSVPMMVNVEDRFVSFKHNRLWFQNEGLYCNFFGKQYDFWMQYRVTPEPYSDKIWTNIDYRADFYHILDENGESMISVDYDLTGLDEYDYQDEETFDMLRVWNEYQTTYNFIDRPQKKFRIWRYAIPRAASNSGNLYSFDRIRNPWINVLFKKCYDDDSPSNQDLMQLHDITVRYFE